LCFQGPRRLDFDQKPEKNGPGSAATLVAKTGVPPVCKNLKFGTWQKPV